MSRVEGEWMVRILIEDLAEVAAGADSFIPTTDLLSALASRRPDIWGDQSPSGRPLTAQRLGRFMSHAGVFTWQRDRRRGYLREHLVTLTSAGAEAYEDLASQLSGSRSMVNRRHAATIMRTSHEPRTTRAILMPPR